NSHARRLQRPISLRHGRRAVGHVSLTSTLPTVDTVRWKGHARQVRLGAARTAKGATWPVQGTLQ
ncbi:MAG: hypothetical protein ACRD1T_21440, partial [Acidimicrobiia bacterium]